VTIHPPFGARTILGGSAEFDYSTTSATDNTIKLSNPSTATGATMGFEFLGGAGWDVFLRSNQGNNWLELTDASGNVQHHWNAGNYTAGGSISIQGTLSIAGGAGGACLTVPQQTKVCWQDTNSNISSWSRATYFDEYGGGWNWRDSSNSLAGRMTLSGASGSSNGLNVPGTISAGGNLTSTPGDMSANRGNGTGVIYLGSGSTYLYYDGSNYQMPGHSLYVGSDVHAGGSVYVNNMLVTQDGGNMFLRCQPGYGHYFQDTGGGWVQANMATCNVSNQFRFNGDGSYLLMSGGTIYYRSTSNADYFQNTGGGWVQVQCQDVVANGALYSAGTNCHIGGDGTNCNYYAYNGSGNHRFFHNDSSWMGCQAANFQPQSNAVYKKDIQPMSDGDCLARVRQPADTLPIITWQPEWHHTRMIGFTAQQMEDVVPEVVGYSSEEGHQGEIFGIHYMNLTAVLWGALRLLDQRVQALEGTTTTTGGTTTA
jgi:hypothetical protein